MGTSITSTLKASGVLFSSSAQFNYVSTEDLAVILALIDPVKASCSVVSEVIECTCTDATNHAIATTIPTITLDLGSVNT